MSGVGSSPSLATYETSQVLLVGVSGGFPGVLPFRPTYRLACLDMSEIIFKGTLNRIKKKTGHMHGLIILLTRCTCCFIGLSYDAAWPFL